MKILALAMDDSLYAKSRSLEIHFLEQLAKMGHEVACICPRQLYYDSDDPQPENFEFHVIPINESRFVEIEEWWEAYEGLMFGEVDIVYATSISGCNLGRYLADLYGCPFICELLDIPTFRFMFKNYADEWDIYLTQLRQADHIVVNTTVCKEILISRDFDADKITKIFYGIDCDLPDKIPEQEKLYDIVCVGRLESHKAPEKLIYVLAKLKEWGIAPKVAVIGEGRYLQPMIELAHLAKVHFFYLGAVDDYTKYKTIKQSKLMYVTDVCNVIGSLVGTEALYCKVPVICSDMPVNHERLGICPAYVNPFDITEAAASIKNELKKTRSQDYFEDIVRVIKRDWSYQKQAELTLKLFEEIKGKSLAK